MLSAASWLLQVLEDDWEERVEDRLDDTDRMVFAAGLPRQSLQQQLKGTKTSAKLQASSGSSVYTLSPRGSLVCAPVTDSSKAHLLQSTQAQSINKVDNTTDGGSDPAHPTNAQQAAVSVGVQVPEHAQQLALHDASTGHMISMDSADMSHAAEAAFAYEWSQLVTAVEGLNEKADQAQKGWERFVAAEMRRQWQRRQVQMRLEDGLVAERWRLWATAMTRDSWWQSRFRVLRKARADKHVSFTEHISSQAQVSLRLVPISCFASSLPAALLPLKLCRNSVTLYMQAA